MAACKTCSRKRPHPEGVHLRELPPCFYVRLREKRSYTDKKVLCCGIFKCYFINIIDGYTFSHLLLFFQTMFLSFLQVKVLFSSACFALLCVTGWSCFDTEAHSKFYFNVPSMEFWLQIHQGTLINLFSLFNVACLMKWILLLTFVCCCQMLATQFLTWARYDKNEFTSSWNPSMNQ